MALRSIEFTNGEVETTVFGTSPYLILRVEGLGIPGVDTFQQKAPNQDGTTYIDSLLQNRDLVIEIAITTPNAFMDIAAYRRQLSQRLCPKYGVGSLLYTDEAGHQYALSARAASVVFPNKDYRDPYARAQVTFTAHEPYWRDVNEKTGVLPTSETSGETVINAAVSKGGSFVQLVDNPFFLVYVRGSDDYLVSRSSTDGLTWSAESVVTSSTCLYPSLIQQSDGSLRVAYIATSGGSTGPVVQKTSADGITWSAQTTIIATAGSKNPSLIQTLAGGFMVFYINGTSQLVYTTSADGITWATAIVIGGAVPNNDTPSLIQQLDGTYRVAYKDNNSTLSQITSSDGASWSSPSLVVSAPTNYPSLIEKRDGSFVIVFGYGTSYLAIVTSQDGSSWGAVGAINTEISIYPCVIQLNDDSLMAAYQKSVTSYLVSVTRSVTPVPKVVIGDVSTPIKVTFQGPSVNPRIIKQNTLEYIRLNTTLSATDSFIVDTTFGNKTVKLLQGGIEKNGIAFLDIGSTFFQLDRPTLPSLPIGVDPWYGLKAYYAMDGIPEIPDDPAGVTYLQDAWATTDSFLSYNATLSVATTPGALRTTVTASGLGANARRVITGINGKTWRVKIRGSKLASANISYFTSTLVPLKTVSITTDWQIIDTYLTSGSTNDTIYFDLPIANWNAGDWIEIDFIYIGTGAYLPNSLLDSSGNAKHGTIYGATPDGQGGLIRDGINDYEVTVAAQTMPNVFWYHELLTVPNNATEIQILYGVGVAGAARLVLARAINSTSLAIIYWNGTANTTITIAGFFPPSTELATADVVIDWLTGIISVYKNGACFASATMTLMEKPAAALWYYGNQSTLLSTEAAAGTFNGRRLFNRAPNSAEEVLFLYQNPDTAVPIDADVVYYEDDSVASTAVATLEYTERFTGI